MTMKAFAGVLVLVLATATVTLAHHGLTVFDQAHEVTLEGTVTAFRFVNPHAIVEFDVKDDIGQVKHWQAELTTPVRLKGWTPTSLEPGIIVTVTGYPAKGGALYLWVTGLRASNGVAVETPSASANR